MEVAVAPTGCAWNAATMIECVRPRRPCDLSRHRRNSMNRMQRFVLTAGLTAGLVAGLAGTADAQVAAAPPVGSAFATPDNAVLLTVFLRHDQSKPLSAINAELAKQGFYKAFPAAGVEVVSWNVVMGIGQIIVLRFPATRLREVNRVLEDTAWGPYRTEFYVSYDYKSVGMGEHDKAQ